MTPLLSPTPLGKIPFISMEEGWDMKDKEYRRIRDQTGDGIWRA